MRKSSNLAAKVAGASALALLLAVSAFADDRPRQETWRNGQSRGETRRSSGVIHRDDGQARQNDGYRQNDGQARQNDGYRQNDAYRQDGDHRQQNRSEDHDGAIRNDARVERNGRNDRAETGRRGNEGYRNNGSYNHRNTEAYNYRQNGRVNYDGRIDHFRHEHGGYRVWLLGAPYPFWVPESYWHPGWGIGININLGGIFRNDMVYADAYDPYYDNQPYYGSVGRAADYLSGYVDQVDYRTGQVWIRDDRDGRVFQVDTRSIDPRYSRIDARDLRRGDRVSFTGAFLRNGLFAADRVDSVDTRPY